MTTDDPAFPWHRLKNGFRGFETLALDYINERAKPSSGARWEPTKQTHDKNKDAVVYLSYVNKDDRVQWWMEAKYSTETGRLTRYRIDSTVVSAYISGNVERIYFVTNVSVPAKTAIDIRCALARGTCETVVFYSKPNLERWLLDDYERFEKYLSLDDMDSQNRHELFDSIERPGLVIESDTLSLYSAYARFSEPMKTLYEGEPYIAAFNVFSDHEAIVKVELESHRGPLRLRGEKVNGRKTTWTARKELSRGSNPVQIGLKLENPKKDAIVSPVLRVHEIGQEDKVLSIGADALTCIPELSALTVESQEEFIEQATSPASGPEHGGTYVLTGKLGVGKTRSLGRVRKHYANKGTITLGYTFYTDQLENARTLKNLLLDLLLPFLPNDELDCDYLSHLDFREGPKELVVDLLAAKSLEDYLSLLTVENAGGFVLDVGSSNSRLILFDDVDLLTPELQGFLFKLLYVLQIRGYRLLSVLAGRNASEWRGLAEYQKKCATSFFSCEIGWDDVAGYLNIRDLPIDKAQAEVYFSSIPELMLFSKYYFENYGVAEDGAAEAMLLTFRGSSIFKQYAINRFDQEIFENPALSKAAKGLFTFIYYCPNHLRRDACREPGLAEPLESLYKTGLVILDSNDCIAPLHESYVGVFRENYRLEPSHLELVSDVSPLAKLMMRMELAKSAPQTKERAEQQAKAQEALLDDLDALLYNQQFHSLYHVLKPTMGNTKDDSLVKLWFSESRYFILKWLYTYAKGNVAHDEYTFDDYVSLNDDLESCGGPAEVKEPLLLLMLFEVVNSTYEHSEYAKAQECNDRLQKAAHAMESIPGEYRYSQLVKQRRPGVQSLNLLIRDASDEDIWEDALEYILSLNKDETYKRYVFEILRVSMTQLTSHFDYAKELVNACYSECEGITDNPKAVAMCEFASKFLSYADSLGEPMYTGATLAEVEESNQRLRHDFENDYNRHIPVLTVANLIEHRLGRAKKLLDGLDVISREPTPRLAYAKKLAQGLIVALDDHAKSLRLHRDALEDSKLSPSYNTAPSHNIAVLESGHAVDGIDFYRGQNLRDGTLYFDIRLMF